ncbi:MAG: hypothetical protein M1828_001511 [Chrysothrix sp. TS-e1954]|nr:MAG: hypothetical protein M1828_001511 [Chrysothrix sp. TS-e1954]
MGKGDVIYGVNTGFGGSANTRTNKVDELQRVLVRELHYGVLATSDYGLEGESTRLAIEGNPGTILSRSLDNEDPETATCMPKAWTRAAILIRINSLALGFSGIRPVILDRMADLLIYNIIPCVPLRGSISASGDLSPLSYISGTLQAKPSLLVWSSDAPSRKTAAAAFAEHGLGAVQMGPKETLAIVNGTATSCGVAVLALNDVNHLALLAQTLTAMSIEGLRGATESFDSLFASVRPHPGQQDASENIRSFLKGSTFVRDADDESTSLRQDRYSIRTAAQWIGPVLEDLLLSSKQLSTECNSVTDNPIIDTQGDTRSLHGGNFQAMAVTSAMEKARHATYTIGRMLFSQVTELINPATSRGLPPNLVVDEPSLSFILKAVDLQSAALTSELGFLAHAVNNVQSAEQGNQSINSLALISARYTHTAADVLSILTAGHLLAVCQALDIRAMLATFFEQLEPEFRKLLIRYWSPAPGSKAHDILWSRLHAVFNESSHMDLEVRFQYVSGELRATLLDTDIIQGKEAADLAHIASWRDTLVTNLVQTYTAVREAYLAHGDASGFLGSASRRIYRFIRKDLGVPFLHSAMLRSPDGETLSGRSDTQPSPLTVGSYITKIYRAMRSGVLIDPVMACIADVERGNGSPPSQSLSSPDRTE